MTRRKRIVVDARMVGPVGGHGIARYVQGMSEGLRAMSPLPYDLVFLLAADSPEDSFRGFETTRIAAPFLHPKEWIEIPRALKRLGADLYHSPSFASLPKSPCPWIVTVHDLIHLEHGGTKEKIYYQMLLKRFIRGARAILTVSEHSRRGIAKWAGIDPSRIDALPNPIDAPVDPKLAAPRLASLGLKQGEFFLCLANTKPHKNLEVLLEAYLRIRERGGPVWQLALTAPGPELPGVVRVGPLGGQELLAFVAASGALFSPSIEEGFGRPPLEAAVARVPIAVSDIPPHREALSLLKPDEAYFVPPLDSGEWGVALRRAQEGMLRRPSPQSCAALLATYSSRSLASAMDRVHRSVLGLEP